jgi:hypothetical protein
MSSRNMLRSTKVKKLSCSFTTVKRKLWERLPSHLINGAVKVSWVAMLHMVTSTRYLWDLRTSRPFSRNRECTTCCLHWIMRPLKPLLSKIRTILKSLRTLFIFIPLLKKVITSAKLESQNTDWPNRLKKLLLRRQRKLSELCNNKLVPPHI